MNEILLLEVNYGQNDEILWNNTKNDINFDKKNFVPMEFEISKIYRKSNFFGDTIEIKMLYLNDLPLQELIDSIVGKMVRLFRSIDGINYDVLISGVISSYSTKTTEIIFNIEDNFSKFKKSIVKYYTKKCKTSFCSKECTLNIENFSYSIKIAKVSQYSICVENKLPDVLFIGGFVKFMNGNFTKTIQIRDVISSEIFFSEDLPFFIKNGDAITLLQACDKTFAMCGKFGNQANFRGEIVI